MSERKDNHRPVMLEEVLAHWRKGEEEDGIYVDATFGRGGHAGALLRTLRKGDRLIAIDRDPEAVRFGETEFASDPRFSIDHAAFSQLRSTCDKHGVFGKVDGLLVDLGVSSPQLDTPERGMSFLREGPLDMRMDPTTGVSCASWLAKATEAEIADVLKVYGEERFARRIAAAIVQKRTECEITTTTQLVAIIEAAVPYKDPHKHVATRSFQALRIFINEEMEELQALLSEAWEVLKVGGRLLVISFHSLEDRVVKRFLQQKNNEKNIPRGIAILLPEVKPKWRLYEKQKPSKEEQQINRRSRSALLRIAEKIA